MKFLFSFVIKSRFIKSTRYNNEFFFYKDIFVFGFGDKNAKIYLQGRDAIAGKTGKTEVLP